MPEAELDIEAMQADAGDEHRRDRHQRDGAVGGIERHPQDGALVLAEQLFDPPQGDRIDVPGVAGNLPPVLDTLSQWPAG
jgi:hypothetical protein